MKRFNKPAIFQGDEMALLYGRRVRSVEEIAEYATSMRNGQTISFPFVYGEREIQQIFELIRKKTPLTTFSIENLNCRLVVQKYQIDKKEWNFLLAFEVVLWQAYKMLPGEESKFCLGERDNSEKVAKLVMEQIELINGKRYKVSLEEDPEHLLLVVSCLE